MKKAILGVAAVAAMSAMAISASAANNAGTPIYYTETEAFVNGVAINSYNADNHTVVNVAELPLYGFNVDAGNGAISISALADNGICYDYASTWAANAAARSLAFFQNNSSHAGELFRVTAANGPTVYINGVEVDSYTAGGETFIQFKDLVMADDILVAPWDLNDIHKGYSASMNKTWIDVDYVTQSAWCGDVTTPAVVETRQALDQAIANLNAGFVGLEIPWSGSDYLAAYPNTVATEWNFPVHDVATGIQVATANLNYNPVNQDQAFSVNFVVPTMAVLYVK